VVNRRALDARALADGGRRWRFVGDEATGFVGAVAKGASGGLAAAAEGDCGLVGGDFEFGAAGVDELEGALDDEGAVRTHANGDVGHWCSLRSGCGFAATLFWRVGGRRSSCGRRFGRQHEEHFHIVGVVVGFGFGTSDGLAL
jgi:hypothetical protein